MGELLRWSVRREGRALVLTVEHVGFPLGGAAVTLLGRELGSALGAAVTVEDRAYPDAELVASAEDVPGWLSGLSTLATAARELPALHLCVRVPAPPPPPPARARPRRPPPAADPRHTLRPVVTQLAAGVPSERLSIVESDALAARLSIAPCSPRAEAPDDTDAGAGAPAQPGGAPDAGPAGSPDAQPAASSAAGDGATPGGA